MNGKTGFFVAVLGLTLFESVVSSDTATTAAGGLLGLPATFVKDLTDPTVTLWGSPVAATTTPAPGAQASTTATTAGSSSTPATTPTPGVTLGEGLGALFGSAPTSSSSSPSTAQLI